MISPENLVITKLLAGRPKDLQDIRELLAIRALDHARIECLLVELEGALDQRDLIPLYQRLRNEAKA